MTVRIDGIFQGLLISTLCSCIRDIEKIIAMAEANNCMVNHNFEQMLMDAEFRLRDLRKTLEENF